MGGVWLPSVPTIVASTAFAGGAGRASEIGNHAADTGTGAADKAGPSGNRMEDRFIAAEKPASSAVSTKCTQRLYSAEMKTLMERAAKKDPDVKFVKMSQAESITVAPGDAEKIIWTHSLNGCVAALAVAQNDDGVRSAILAHLLWTEALRGGPQWCERIAADAIVRDPSARKHLLIMALGEMVLDAPFWEGSRLDVLIPAARAVLGSPTTLTVIPYDLYDSRDVRHIEDLGTFRVAIPPAGKGLPRYHTWFHSGTLD